MNVSLEVLREKLIRRCSHCNEYGLDADEQCSWYGEPNGCNSPVYGEDPRINAIKEIVKAHLKPEIEYAVKSGGVIVESYKHFNKARKALNDMKRADKIYDNPNPPNYKIVARLVYKTPWVNLSTEI